MNTSSGRYVFLGNNLAIDFINTQFIQHGKLVDMLVKPEHLSLWAEEANRPVASNTTEKDLIAAKALRTALNDLFQAKMHDEISIKQQSLAVINEHLANHATHQTLQLNGDGGGLELKLNDYATTFTSLMAEVAYQGAQLLSSEKVLQVKKCSNTACVLLFVDTSRTQKRRWCSMKICGNRAKVAKHYKNLQQ